MKTLLLSGNLLPVVANYTPKKVEIINTKCLAIEDVVGFLNDVNPVFECALITDQAFSGHTFDDRENLLSFINWIDNSNRVRPKIVILTNDFMLKSEHEEVFRSYESIELICCEYIRVPEVSFREAYNCLTENNNEDRVPAAARDVSAALTPEKDKKKSFLDRFRSVSSGDKAENNQIDATDYLTREISKISRGISRVVAVTGHRGSGVTSSVVNIAYEASKRGLSTFIIDLDKDYRSINMFFDRYHEITKTDECINASLIRTLARPQDFMTTAFNINENLWLTSLGYSFYDNRLTDQFYSSNKLVGLLSVLRSKFNIVILDIPLDLFKVFTDVPIHIDVFGMCVSNNLYSILSTLRNIEVVFDREDAAYLNAKSKLIITKYNDRSRFQNEIFIPQTVSEVLTSGLSEYFVNELKVAGYVPYNIDFDIQIETDVPIIMTNAEHDKAYGNILLKLIEGA